MTEELSREDQRKFLAGMRKMPCPECGEYLLIEEQVLSTGGKGISYRCKNLKCSSISGTILIPWHKVISNALKNHIVKVAMVLIAVIFTFLGGKINSLTSDSSASTLEVQLRQELENNGYIENSENADVDEIMNCIRSALSELKQYKEAEEWVTKNPYKSAILSLLRGKQEGLLETHNFSKSQGNPVPLELNDHEIAFSRFEGLNKGKTWGIEEARRLLMIASPSPGSQSPSIDSSFRNHQ